MKSTVFAEAFGVLIVAVSLDSSAQSENRPETCSQKTLTGTYIYSIQGYRGGQPYASSGLLSFDGEGKVRVLYTSSIERTQLSTDGTYSVQGNCSGSMTLAGGTVVNNFYLSPDGDSVHFVRVSADDVIGTEAKRVSPALIAK